MSHLRQSSSRLGMRVRAMTLDEKIGQLVMAGFHGTSPSPGITRLIREHHLGGVLLFSRNIVSPTQTARLVNRLQSLAREKGGPPLLVAMDQEGGLVARIRKGAAVHPGNMALGSVGEASLARLAGLVTGTELRAMGVNMNLAPVMDVNINPMNPVIGVRSFGEDAACVSQLGVAMIRGLQQSRVVATAKHFPGHGDTSVDPHYSLPIVEHGLDRLRTVELKPFEAAIRTGVRAVMVSHISFPAIEDQRDLPTSLSERVVSGLLRRGMGFSRLILTDCMEMKAVSDRFEAGEAAVRAVRAGADLVLVSHSFVRQVESLKALCDAAKVGELQMDRIDQSVRRVLKEKLWLAGIEPFRGRVKRRVGSKKHLAIVRRLGRKAVTLLRNPAAVLPFRRPSTRRVLCVACMKDDGDIDPLSRVLSEEAPKELKVVQMKLPVNPRMDDIRRAIQHAQEVDAVVVATARADLLAGQARLLGLLGDSSIPLVVVSTREPYDLTCAPANASLIACYGPAKSSLLGVCDVLLGRVRPAGSLPVTIPNLYPRGYGMKRFWQDADRSRP